MTLLNYSTKNGNVSPKFSLLLSYPNKELIASQEFVLSFRGKMSVETDKNLIDIKNL